MGIAPSPHAQPEPLSCRIRFERAGDSETFAHFVVEICGAILSDTIGQEAHLQVSIDDVTEGAQQVLPVLERRRRRGLTQAPTFTFPTVLGQLKQKVTTLTNWTAVARIQGKGKCGHSGFCRFSRPSWFFFRGRRLELRGRKRREQEKRAEKHPEIKQDLKKQW